MNAQPKKIILASTSPTRRALLDATGLVYEARSPQFEEVAPEGLTPKEVARFLAQGKARAAQQTKDEILIGADQVLDLDGRALGKHPNASSAKEGLRALSGREHALHTGVAIRWGEQEESFVETTLMKARALSEEELDAYVATNEWQGCAGGYRIEGKGVCLFEEIQGDYFNILGLPVLRVLSVLRKLGVSLF